MTVTASARAHFQPIVDVRQMRVAGFEALTRFDDGVSPLEHLHLAETRGEREQLELQLIEVAVAAAAELPVNGFVTLNASGTTMTDPLLAEVLRRADRRWGLELFEGADPEECLSVREQVDRLGGFLLIDDAGAGFADEKRIRQLDPDIVKIDRALFWQSLTDAAGRERIASIFTAARDVAARTLVEGVESAEQFDAVRELGADYAQGYHLGQPTPVQQVAAMLADLRQRVQVGAESL